MTPGLKIAPPWGLSVFHSKIFKNLLLWNLKAQSFDILHVASPNGALLSLFKWWPTGSKWPSPWAYQFFIVKAFKKLFLWNLKDQTFDIWYVALPNYPLPRLFKLWPPGSKWPRPRAYQFFIVKTLKNLLLWKRKDQIKKIFFSETVRTRPLIFGM